MRKRMCCLLAVLVLLLTACTTTPETVPVSAPPAPTTIQTAPSETEPQPVPEPSPDTFVRILDYIPSARQELPYATDQNFTAQRIYDFTDAWLRYGTVKKLMAVSADLAQLGLYLKIWDGFRPVSAQRRLWEVCPNSAYVANPNSGTSPHCRGNTVDLTLVDADGSELEMPTAFDDFSKKADRDYSDCTEAAAAHAQLLEILMEKHGFVGYSREWWHFSDTEEYPVEESFCPPDT